MGLQVRHHNGDLRTLACKVGHELLPRRPQRLTPGAQCATVLVEGACFRILCLPLGAGVWAFHGDDTCSRVRAYASGGRPRFGFSHHGGAWRRRIRRMRPLASAFCASCVHTSLQ